MTTLSNKITNTLNKNNVELDALLTMTQEEILAIKGIGPKALEEINLWIESNKPTEREPEFDVSSIEKIREHILSNKKCEEVFNSSKADRDVKEVTDMFLNRKVDYRGLANALNSLYGKDEHMAVMVGKLSVKIKMSVDKKWNNFYFEKMKAIMASLLLHGLVDTDQINYEKKTDKEIDERGKVKWHKRTYITVGEKKEKDPLFGLHTEPGQVLQKFTKVKTGGKSLKLSLTEKSILNKVSSMPLKLVKTPRDTMEQYLKQCKWYLEAKAGKSNEDPILLEDRVQTLLDNIEKAQEMPVIYLSAWLDYRTRLYYDFTLEGINPHGKTFQTSQWELAVPEVITDQAIHDYYYSAVCIIDGRTTHEAASRRFLANKDKYLMALKKESGNMDKDFYNSRLAEAIEDYYAGKPSHFLLSEDATNGGMQHGGIGFRCEPMMKSSNVGGMKSQQDSHGDLQKKLGLAERDDAKAIHQPLLHGASMKSIAKSMNVSEPEAKDMMVKAYGKEVLNIPTIAQYGADIVDNNNTTLMWKTYDGFKAQSIAHVESVPLTIYAPSGSNKSGYSTIQINKDMPIIVDAKGKSIYGATIKEDGTQDKSNGGSTKLRGLYANITHSIDASILRFAIKALATIGKSGLFKHDNFLCHGNYMGIVRGAYKVGLLEMFEYQAYDKALEQIRDNYKGVKPPKLELKKGSGTKEMIDKSEYFLSA